MSRILPPTGDSQSNSTTQGDRLFINQTCYANSASKFWYGLIDEVNEDYPDCSVIEMSACTADRLNPDILFPEIALGRDLELLLLSDIETERRNTTAELEIIGPPPPVVIRLLSGDSEIIATTLSLDIIDAGIFSCMVAWLLKWADIPATEWNNDRLSDEFSIEDRKRKLAFTLSFSMEKKHLSEGLFRRIIRIRHSVASQSGTVNTAAP